MHSIQQGYRISPRLIGKRASRNGTSDSDDHLNYFSVLLKNIVETTYYGSPIELCSPKVLIVINKCDRFMPPLSTEYL